MLVLSRKVDQKILVGPDITITLVDIRGDKVRIGIDAPPNVMISRDDLISNEPKKRDQKASAHAECEVQS